MQDTAERLAYWHAGPFRRRTSGLVFGAMYEDPAIELDVFPPHSRAFCIASAGCTARALARAGHEVTAIDVNAEQIAYARARAAGALSRKGAVERWLATGRSLLPLAGWTEDRLRRFLSMRNCSEQIHFWHDVLDSRRYRAGVDLALSRALLRFLYASPFIAALPARFGALVRARLERTWANHANASNPYAWSVLLGESPDAPERPTPGIRFVCAEAVGYLEASKPASFDAFTLSNIGDGAPAAHWQRLLRAIWQAATPGALVVMRSFADPHPHVHNLAARDRSMLWGTVQVVKVADLCCTS